tara:strand:+ start:30405 stop:30719 length:315 start_codon:yes stop_codon:yes gene_type:complete
MIKKAVKKTLRVGKGLGKGVGRGLGKGVKKLRSSTRKLKKTLRKNLGKNRKFLKLGGKKRGGMPAEYFGAPMNKNRTSNSGTTAKALPPNTVNNNLVPDKPSFK